MLILEIECESGGMAERRQRGTTQPGTTLRPASPQSDMGSSALTLSESEVHVWQLNIRDQQWDCFSNVLSGDEREKAGRFRYARLRESSFRSRIALRLVLSRYLDLAADRIQFSYGESGKPGIAGAALFFNVSHSGDLALIATALHPIGVDIELIANSKLNMTDVIETVCHVTERAELDVLSPAGRRRLFYQVWTRKEAFCKAVGVGSQYAFAEVHFANAGSHSAYQVCDDRYGPLPFYAHDLAGPVGYAASICVPLDRPYIQLLGARCSETVAEENQRGI